MNTAGRHELEILRRSMGRTHLPTKPAPVYPSSAPSGHSGRVKLFGLLAAVAIFLAAGPRTGMAASRMDRP
jgi:hypothetical protein